MRDYVTGIGYLRKVAERRKIATSGDTDDQMCQKIVDFMRDHTEDPGKPPESQEAETAEEKKAREAAEAGAKGKRK